ncbi:hypothetical protein BS50DRAFT_493349 [Corynespora cassiicola Philippines]|uniref:YDG domain-containing protein n=1 Tax=Corynespora cassiicola Philippines TaxID=1448308 RepID=A0A2T2NNF7_CORCC|nr:hypothetical protein BS50DRAFT_493349 [Corynespora cassiicola Philippines]
MTTPHSPMSLPSPTPSVDSIVLEAKGVNLFPVPKKLPEWHAKVNTTGFTFKTRTGHPQARQTVVALSHLKTCIERCERNKDVRDAEKWAQLFNDLRDSIHKAEITLKVDEYILVKTNMMMSTVGLARILNSKTVPYPWDVKADAWQLFSRWYDGNFEIDLLRGLVTSTDKKRNRDSIDPEYRSKFPASANCYGEGKLVLGQWWPTQLCTVRDGAHGCPQGGIYGERGRGCYSIVLSGMGESAYQDEDNGDDIWYSGTDGKDYQMTDATQRLMDTCKTIRNPVRVIRSHQLHKNNPYRPRRGLRYDGLYDVTEFELIDPVKAVYKFHLVRSSKQHPARWGETQASRPTRFELAAEGKLRGRID